ncbi:ParA family protein [Bacteroides acidifaciens]|jgi:ATPases involved in chromosome partitioning|uniref:ParA family protein n=1 Tax=Bacteroides acidifaciens TaxID=85831 RepID=UPI000F48BE62|nr:ParA family protein [Bacteroides acidifaciens]ROT16591.1 ParA family protein [Muribaculaceae bacterium Isolate-110 (HZI)]
MVKIIAVVNHKGGVGKTTTTVNLGAALSRLGKRILLVDMDSQQNLTTSLMKEEDVTKSIFDSLMQNEPLPIVRISEGLDLCPSELALAAAELHLQARIGRESILKKLLNRVRDDYDFIFIDCPPSLGLFTINALVAATDVFLPLTGETLPLRGIIMLDETLNDVIQNANSDLKITGVIIQRYNNRKLNNEVIEAITSKFGARVFDTKIRECIALAEAPAAHCSIFDYDSKSNGASDYMALANEVLMKLS